MHFLGERFVASGDDRGFLKKEVQSCLMAPMSPLNEKKAFFPSSPSVVYGDTTVDASELHLSTVPVTTYRAMDSRVYALSLEYTDYSRIILSLQALGWHLDFGLRSRGHRGIPHPPHLPTAPSRGRINFHCSGVESLLVDSSRNRDFTLRNRLPISSHFLSHALACCRLQERTCAKKKRPSITAVDDRERFRNSTSARISAVL
jgi:hypothetical protein